MTKSTPGYIVKILAIAAIAGVLVWRYYYFKHLLAAEFTKISWVNAVAVYFLLALALLLIVSIVCRAFSLSKDTKMKASLLVLSVFAGILSGEFVMRKTGHLAMYSETRTGYYNSYFKPLQDSGWFHVLPPHHEMYLQGPEFKYYRKTNSLGYPDHEPVVEKQDGEIRLMTLGDSFTAGDGAPFDSSYPQLLVKMLGERYPDRKISLVNAGVFGSDPYFDYMGLREKLLKYKPDIVFETIAGGDLFDIYYHGNLSRFKPGGKLQFNAPPWWEPIYAVCRLSRLIFMKMGYDTSLIRESEKREIFEKEKDELRQLYAEYNKLAGENNFEVIVFIRPEKYECEQNSYFVQLDNMAQYPDSLKRIHVVDLMRYSIEKKKIKSHEFKNYYWPLDGHYNSRGYKIMAEAALTATAPIIDSLL